MAATNHRRSVKNAATPGSARMLMTPRSANGCALSGSSASGRRSSASQAASCASYNPDSCPHSFTTPTPRCGGLAVLPAQPDIFPSGLAHSHCAARATPIHRSTAYVPARPGNPKMPIYSCPPPELRIRHRARPSTPVEGPGFCSHAPLIASMAHLPESR